MAKGAKESRAERRRAVIGYRAVGKSFREIARILGISVGCAHADAEAAFASIRKETRETTLQLITLESERLDALQAAFWVRAISGDLRAVDIVLRVMESRRKLLALDKEFPDDEPPLLSLGIDPALCTAEELATLYDIVRRQSEKRAD